MTDIVHDEFLIQENTPFGHLIFAAVNNDELLLRKHKQLFNKEEQEIIKQHLKILRKYTDNPW